VVCDLVIGTQFNQLDLSQTLDVLMFGGLVGGSWGQCCWESGGNMKKTDQCQGEKSV
jgi:hypothetical protein